MSIESALYDSHSSHDYCTHAEPHYEALQQARARQKDATFWEKYRVRSGIEGTISQGVRAFGMRSSRYREKNKTHLQHVIIATAMNMVRALAWLEGQPRAHTRISRFAALPVVC